MKEEGRKGERREGKRFISRFAFRTFVTLSGSFFLQYSPKG